MNQTTWSPARIWITRLIVVAAFFSLWELTATKRWIDPILIGKPSGILAFMFGEIFVTHSLLKDFAYTITATLSAFVLGSVCGAIGET